ncbi:hypothetical protein ACBR55_12235 [Salinicoccus roseus]|uniref:Uncharacterized protein n=1 Tax=Salinicoccus roseus TaxID=45670 RepID=A0A0C2H7V6_9STAP|nr:hypothetical protein [Salinicoccus roseus]KIH69915.1 hypothetical protein SN16_10375 [Salinicoccus roseus]MDB0581202.1 hypothetical protein [Salinicoccus roseus]
MPMFVAENEEQLLEVFKKVAKQIQPHQEKDERLYLSVKDFAKDTGISETFLRTHILYDDRFKRFVSQIDRKIYIKRHEGRRALEKIMDDYRR